jgi:hypothetical protein
MRTFKFTCTAAVLFVGLAFARVDAQPVAGQGATAGVGTLRPRLNIAFGAGPARASTTPSASRTLTQRGGTHGFVMPAPGKPGEMDPSLARPPVDCRMPVLAGDPGVDAKMVTPPPPADLITFFLRILPVPACAGR